MSTINGISLVMATYGRAEEILTLIDSLAEQTNRDFELIIVDQNSDDRLLPYIDIAKSKGIETVYHRLDRPSLSVARNLGITLAKHDVVAFPDDDCWYDPGCISAALALFRFEPGVDIVVGRWVEQAGGKVIASHYMTRQAWRCFKSCEASSISLFVRKDLLMALNGFDIRLGVGHWFGSAEETDLILRALDKEASILYSSSVEVHHHYNRSSSQDLKAIFQAARRRARGTGALYAKHRLSLYVITRGIIAPVLAPLMSFQLSVPILAKGASLSLGRVEGFLAWKMANLRTAETVGSAT